MANNQNPSPPASGVRTQSESLKPSASRAAVVDRSTDRALKAIQVKSDEARLMAILAKEPSNAGALAGMGWIRSQQGNFLGAISFLEPARLQRPDDHALNLALQLAGFRFHMSEAQNALTSNDLTTAEKRYQSFVEIRPNNLVSSAGLRATRLRLRQTASSIPRSQGTAT
jgi:cellulose synthase operon protein C